MPNSWNPHSLRVLTRANMLLLLIAAVLNGDVTAPIPGRLIAQLGGGAALSVSAALLKEEVLADGRYTSRRTLPEEALRSGDRFHLEVAAPFDGHLYILMKGSEGDTRILAWRNCIS